MEWIDEGMENEWRQVIKIGDEGEKKRHERRDGGMHD